VLDTVSRSRGKPQTIPDCGGMGGAAAAVSRGMAPQPPDPAQVAAALARYQAWQALREFRARLYGCLTARPDAAFELVDAILCADHAVTSLAELSLVPAFRRGHGALYDALAAGRIDAEKLAVLLTGTLPSWSTGTRAGPGRLSMTGSTTACWTAPWPACRPGRPPRSGRRARGETLDVLFPHLTGRVIDRVFWAGTSVRIRARTDGPAATCPACDAFSQRAHSRYLRRLSNTPVAGQQTMIDL
jgi:hypothetical protein